jgi:very-short-patch-repair endonuclease
MSVSEQWFWHKSRHNQLGFRVRRQYPIGPYVLDFYIPRARIAVEIDGEQHLNRVDKDKARDEFLAEFGILTLRLPSIKLFDDDSFEAHHFVKELCRLVGERSTS